MINEIRDDETNDEIVTGIWGGMEMNYIDERLRRARIYAGWSFGILLCGVLIIMTITTLDIGGWSTWVGYIFMFAFIGCPIISLVFAILSLHAKVTFVSVLVLVLSILVIIYELTVVVTAVWLIQSACNYATGPEGEEVIEEIRKCGEIG